MKPDTKLGPEEITGIFRMSVKKASASWMKMALYALVAEVDPMIFWSARLHPRETELSAEENCCAPYSAKREVKDTSLRMPHGEWGKVINVKLFSRDEGAELPVRVNQWVQVWVAQKRSVSVGDKLAGRHGNKASFRNCTGADMPFLPDGTPVDIVLNPIGVPPE